MKGKQVLIIFFDLADPSSNRAAVVRKIKSFGQPARLGDSAYLISTTETPVAVRDKVNAVMGASDRIYVGVAPAPSAWVGMPETVSNWILANNP